ncbi:MAG: bifunctional UDP-N-acetylglucosamine diphosphorylase/glucosamine-1-phosphate N-acetyltransferase GlmU [Xanthomonadales bacterium]|nr:bifunctional UDP-N-acetylglucosamine diphosphorylase/glucosamine-1-phosphate N-acetyltransferase GlmU [Xanthomonadales bacterium]
MPEQHTQSLHIVILAAGEGTRMRSNLPKILQPLGGRPMLSHLLDTARQLNPAGIHIVIGSQSDAVMAAFTDTQDINWVHQAERLGTGHAVQQALPAIPDDALILVLYGDHPLVSLQDLESLTGTKTELSLLTMLPESPQGYGRILRDSNTSITGIVEQKDASAEQLKIKEVNTGILVASQKLLNQLLNQIDSNNSQKEFYLTDIFSIAHTRGIEIQAVVANDAIDLQGANDRRQLAMLERRYQQQQANQLMDAGVSLADPARVDVRGTVEVGRDVSIDINVILEGKVVLADNVYIGAGVRLKNVEIGCDTRVEDHSVIEAAQIGVNCNIGPFARVRPGTVLADEVKIGNFVEIKKSTVAKGSKASHLSYIGDAVIGANVNIGAGTITCNYDGVNKSKTVIEDGVFIGSDTQLVAPVKIGKNATVGAGSTITRDVAAETLAVSRSKQTNIRGWKRPVKKSD